MVVRVRLFAILRERAGTGELELELPEGARVADALESVGALADGLPLVMAINREYADVDATLHAGDELALIPPVSGGETLAHALITDAALSLGAIVARVRDPRAGAVVTFQGVTRDVQELHYEAYAEMAQERIEAIVVAAFAGAREIIDAIKSQAPIWKKEIEGESAEWVRGRPPTS